MSISIKKIALLWCIVNPPWLRELSWGAFLLAWWPFLLRLDSLHLDWFAYYKILPSGASQAMNWSIGREHSLQVKHFLWYTCLMEIIFSASKTLPLHLGQALLSSSPAWTVQVSNCAPSKNLGFELPLNRKIIFCVFQHILLISLGTWGILAWLFCLWKKRKRNIYRSLP